MSNEHRATPARESTLTRYSLLIAAIVFLAVAPTLTWLEFSSGSENLNVATVLEMRSGGPWLVPTLKGTPRYTKPPLPAWVTAALVPQGAVDALRVDAARIDDAAYRQFAWHTRWPAWLLSCLMLLAVFDLGRTCGGERVGLLASIVCGSCLLFLNFGRFATTDVHLAFWVAVSNAALARVVLRGQWWGGCLVAGVAMGLASMSKGPVALVQSVLPVAIFAAARRLVPSPSGGGPERGPSARFLPILSGLILILLIALPWPIALLMDKPDLLKHWITEITREGATTLQRDPFYNYLILFPRMLPWLGFFVAGILMAIGLDGRREPRRWLPLLLVFVPVIIMSFVKDKPDRYLLPMVGPAAVLVAYAAAEQFKARLNRADIALASIHWVTLAVISIGFIWVASLGISGERWYDGFLTVMSTTGLIVLIVAGIGVWLWQAWALPVTTLIVMLIMQTIFVAGYAHTESGRSEMKPLAALIRAERPAAEVYYFDPSRTKALPVDLNIYLAKVVRSVESLSEVPPGGVLVMLQRSDAPPPRPEGFSFIGKTPAPKNRFWHALEATP